MNILQLKNSINARSPQKVELVSDYVFRSELFYRINTNSYRIVKCCDEGFSWGLKINIRSAYRPNSNIPNPQFRRFLGYSVKYISISGIAWSSLLLRFDFAHFYQEIKSCDPIQKSASIACFQYKFHNSAASFQLPADLQSVTFHCIFQNLHPQLHSFQVALPWYADIHHADSRQ